MKKIWLASAILGTTMICCIIMYPSIYKSEKMTGCSPLPKRFSETELVGTWIAGSPDQSDTLIIKVDRTYKQIIHIEFAERSPIDYESDWQSWHLEYSEDNIAYLHLNGMRFCGMNPAIPCEVNNGGGYDLCRDEMIHMTNEGVLLVLAAKDDPLPGTEDLQNLISLNYPLGSENSWFYSLQEP